MLASNLYPCTHTRKGGHKTQCETNLRTRDYYIRYDVARERAQSKFMYVNGPDTTSDDVLTAVTARMQKMLSAWQANLLTLRQETAVFIEVPVRIVKRDTCVYVMLTKCRELERYTPLTLYSSLTVTD
jgi:lantibiotic modifying enzyme